MNPNFESDDYYEILGLDRNVDENTIRKTYKNLAKKYHPDRHPEDKEKYANIFKKIAEAYDTLSDPEKRKKYDTFGKQGLKQSGQSVDPMEMFNRFFGGSNPFGFPGFGGSHNVFNQKTERTRQVSLLEHNIHLDMKTLYNGKMVKLSINRKHIYTSDDIPIQSEKYMDACTRCELCNGVGQINEMRNIGPGFAIQQSSVCRKCSGSGHKLKNGYIIKDLKEIIEVDVKPGTPKGTKFIFEKKGDMVPGHPISDLIVIILEKPDPNGEVYRDGNDIHINYKIPLADALINNTISYKHFDNRILNINHDYIITPNMTKKVKGEGMPILNSQNKLKGDLYFHFNVIFPTHINPNDKVMLSKVLKITPLDKGIPVNLI